uniref:Clp R domain-containing protein n=1 Tax=Kalanchoe fedtschenkoi TaxID=63787 RepID=A0A7N0TG43_KALFE
MPTPVATARQCLTDDSARALDDAVAVARRRCHSQTTSLHAVSALLALPASRLREACSRARASDGGGGGYSPGLQLRALELCVGVSLDRLPSGKSAAEDEDPPISNSLMAAIKRSQANQRRNPESFHLQQMHQSQQMTAAVVMKVELKHYVLSILDDPIVSRVFGDAGYRSCDVKLGILHPPLSAGLRFGRSMRCPPIFMMESDLSGGSGWRGYGFPFGGGSGEDVDGNCRRIGEVLVKKSGRNPLLVGACANEALVSFKDCVARRKAGILPGEILGLNVVCFAELVEEFVSVGSEEKVRVKLKELEVAAESGPGPGVVVSFGELKVLIGESSSREAVSYLVSRMADLLRRYCGRLWLIGAVEDDAMYKKLVAKHPAVEADWNLHLVPITSKPLGEGFGAKSSLMGSFVPFGGFFSNPSDYKGSLSSTTQITTRCQSCNDKYEQEISTVLKGGGSTSIADQCSSSLPSCLQANLEQSKEADAGKAQHEGTAFRARILGLQKKWNEICQNLHPNHHSSKSAVSSSKFPSVGTGSIHLVEERKQSSSRDSSVSQSSCPNTSPSIATSPSRGSPRENVEIYRVPRKKTQSPPKLSSIASTSKQLHVSVPHRNSCFPPDQVPASSMISVTTDLGLVPASSMISVTTDLGLGTIYASAKHSRNHTIQDNGEHVQSIVTSVSKELDAIRPGITDHMTKSLFHGSVLRRPVDLRDFKSLCQALIDRVCWQDEAICRISHCISRCRSSVERRRSSNLWLGFTAHDKVGKRKIAAALAEAVSGSKHDLIYVDLGAQDGVEQSDSLFCRNNLKGQDILSRGKTVADSIAAKLCSRPHSVVFFENLDKADMLIQSSLSRAVKTAKFPDSHGREISLNNMIFIVSTSKNSEDISCGTKKSGFSEEIISQAKCWKLRITTGHVAAQSSQSNFKNVMITQPELRILGKRKSDETHNCSAGSQKALRSFLDLNLPVEDLENEFENQRSDSDTASVSESSEAWLEEFFNEVDEKVALKPFNFDALADKVLHYISETFHAHFGSKALLQIDHQAIVQILAASWLSDRFTAVEDWVKSVLSRSFVEARQRYTISPQFAVQLVACEGMLMDDLAHDIRLPSSIILN